MSPAPEARAAAWPAPVLRCRPLLGTFVEVAAERPEHADAAFEAIATVHRLMSAHLPDSELSRLNIRGRSEVVPLHPWTEAVLARALHWAQLSDGAFDPTVGGRLQRAGLIPRHHDQPSPDPAATWRDLRLGKGGAELRRACVIDLGGIAKGFAVDRAVMAMVEAGASRGVVNAGGDLRVLGAVEWTVLVARPRDRRPAGRLRLTSGAVATSALHPGRRGGPHLPGRARGWSSATVVAPRAIDADALTKVVFADAPTTRACLRSVGASALRVTRSGAWQELA